MTTLGEFKRVLDIELTNRCNARCTFCPRDATPQQGFMSFDTFKQAIARAEELPVMPEINSAGQGESLLHPQLIEFARYIQSREIPYSITTNASLLTMEKSRALHDTGLMKINFSIGDLFEDYEEVYALDFENSYRNILDFIELNQRRETPCRVLINMVRHDINRDKIKETQAFWKQVGVDGFVVFDQSNRGGSCDNGHYFVGNENHIGEAKELFASEQLSVVCPAAFVFLFIGWNGNYYICCNDYAKTTPLGSVFDYSIEEMDVIKKARLLDGGFGLEACKNCNINPINRVRETMFEIKHGLATQLKLKDKLEELKNNQSKLPPWARPL